MSAPAHPKPAVGHLPESFGIKEGAEEFPLMVVLAVAYACNALCPHCPYTPTNSSIRKNYKGAMFIEPGLFRKIAGECGQYRSLMRLTGGGEPFLHPKMTELIEYAKSVGARIGVINNGSLLTPERADRVLACGTDMIEFSVDAADSATYAVVRKGLKWDTLLRNVDYAMRRRDATASPTRIVVSIVNQKAIEGRIEEVTSFWQARVDNVIVRKYLTWSVNDPGRSADPAPYLEEDTPCPFLFERLNIDTRGRVMVCGYDIAGKTDLGNIRERTIRSIWQGEVFEYYRSKHLAGKGGDIPLCSGCPDWKYRSWTHNYWKVMENAEVSRKNRIVEVVSGGGGE